jgi:hypothetical protein
MLATLPYLQALGKRVWCFALYFTGKSRAAQVVAHCVRYYQLHLQGNTF